MRTMKILVSLLAVASMVAAGSIASTYAAYVGHGEGGKRDGCDGDHGGGAGRRGGPFQGRQKVLMVAPGSRDLKTAASGSLSDIVPTDKVIVTGTEGRQCQRDGRRCASS